MTMDERAKQHEALLDAREALQNSEAINRAIVESIAQNLFLKDRDSVYLAVNDRYAASLGTTPEEIVGKDDFALFPADLADQYRADDRAVMEAGQPRVIEERYTAQGEEYWIRTTKAPVRNAAGEVTAVLGLFEDITDRKLASNALEASERRYRRLFESAKDGILILDADSGNIVDVNPYLERLVGYAHEELLGKQLWEIGAFRDIAASREAFATLQTQKYVRYEDLPLQARDGRKVDVEFVSNVYAVDGGNVIQCNIRDITERRKAETERARLTMAIEQSEEIVFITDATGDIVYANAAFERVTGYPRGETLGRNPRLLKSGLQEASVYDTLWATITAGKTWHGRVINKKKDGTLFTAESSISPVRDATGKITSHVAVERDITADLALDEQVRQGQKMESIGRLAGGIAHDFNNLLSVILAYTGFLLEQVREGDPFAVDLREVMKAGERAAALTRQLLAFGRKQMLQPVALDLNAALADIASMLGRIIGEDIEIVWRPSPGLGLVCADPGQIDQIVMNLVVNARDAMPGGGRLTIETANVDIDEASAALHAPVQRGRYIALSVTDTGTGMDANTLAKIFEPFYTTKQPGKGTGLGLATVYGAVKQTGGDVRVHSEVDNGTTFSIYLPRELDANTAAAVRRPSSAPRAGTATILVVDDEDAIRRVADRILVAAGYTVLTAASGPEALGLAARHSGDIHLLLTDLIMPQMNGKALADELATSRPAVEVLYMSGYSDDGLLDPGAGAPAPHFVAKPFTAVALTQKIGDVLDNGAGAHKKPAAADATAGSGDVEDAGDAV
jgi:PAS domain S-box-containing protein